MSGHAARRALDRTSGDRAVAYDVGSTTFATTQRCLPILRSRTNPRAARRSTARRGRGSRRNRARVLRIALDLAAAEARDRSSAPSSAAVVNALAPVPLADEVARDPPVRQGRERLLVSGPVLELRHLGGRAELAPSPDSRRRRTRAPHESCRPGHVRACVPVQRRVPAVVRMKAHAPAAAKDAVVRFDQRGERIPGRLVESLGSCTPPPPTQPRPRDVRRSRVPAAPARAAGARTAPWPRSPASTSSTRRTAASARARAGRGSPSRRR